MKHSDELFSLLKRQIGNENEVNDIKGAAAEVSEKWVAPLSGGKEQINGLVYGLVQSGKTGVLTACAALGADEGYRTIILLTSDIDPLYAQTLGRAKEAFPGMEILDKNDLKDSQAFAQRIKSSTCAIVITKNGNRLGHLVENFKKASLRGLSCLIIDDEADQASPNTRESREDGSRSKINEHISEIRKFFDKNTYLQVTATPQALFLQGQSHELRPKFTVLSHPGGDYVGGDDFFGEGSKLIREFDVQELVVLSAASQPQPNQAVPRKLVEALDVFMVGATHKRLQDPTQNCAFLCHVSTRTSDHSHIVELLRGYKNALATALKSKNPQVIERLKFAYSDLNATHPNLSITPFEKIVEAVEFYSHGIAVKAVNGETDEDVAVQSPYNLFVGGNKLGRGVTIKNLLVSYYGRNPKAPQADTVLQHARMFGYRRKDIGLLRLYLPNQLLVVFRAIHKMETGLRNLIAAKPAEGFRGVFIEGNIKPTRKNVLAPGNLGIYSASSNYNPFSVVRALPSNANLGELDQMLNGIANKRTMKASIPEVIKLIKLTQPDEDRSEHVWNAEKIELSLLQYEKLTGRSDAFVYVDRERNHDVEKGRGETRGLLDSGEVDAVPRNEVALFLLRQKADREGKVAWWPQIRFPDGNYAFAFAV
ncbi:MAG: DEAD/DEAH box helicase family protein [Alphaproteobacteria bacterium]|nr:DEAD/DEAH box helicase family protein [Alphaproteobacteria bacterium]